MVDRPPGQYVSPGSTIDWGNIFQIYQQSQANKLREKELAQQQQHYQLQRDYAVQDRDFEAGQRREQAKSEYEQKLADATRQKEAETAKQRADRTSSVWGQVASLPPGAQQDSARSWAQKLVEKGVIDAVDAEQVQLDSATAVQKALPKPPGPTDDMLRFEREQRDPEYQAWREQQRKNELEDAKARAVQINMADRTLPVTAVTDMSDASMAEEMVDKVFDQFVQLVPSSGAVDAMGARVSAQVPNTDVNNYDKAVVGPAAQLVGLYMEGGKLADADVPRYRSFFPQPGDDRETAERKRAGLKAMIHEKAGRRRVEFKGAGYRVPQDANQAVTPRSVGGKAKPTPADIEAQALEWKRQGVPEDEIYRRIVAAKQGATQ